MGKTGVKIITQVLNEQRKKGKGDREETGGREVQRFTDGCGCPVDVRRVGSHAAWLRSPEIFFDSSEFLISFYSFSFWLHKKVGTTDDFTISFSLYLS